MIRKIVLSAVMTQALLSVTAFAQLERQHDVHVHGSATGNLSIDGEALRLELEIPGINLVGFEHAPATDQQQSRLDETEAFLRAADWLVADPRGGCEIASVSAHTHGFSEDDDHGHENHDHRHDHAHDHEHGSHEHQGHDHREDSGQAEPHHDHGDDHAEFHLVITMDCETPDRLAWVDLQLFDDFPANQEMAVDVLTDRVATQARLTPGSERVELE